MSEIVDNLLAALKEEDYAALLEEAARLKLEDVISEDEATIVMHSIENRDVAQPFNLIGARRRYLLEQVELLRRTCHGQHKHIDIRPPAGDTPNEGNRHE